MNIKALKIFNSLNEFYKFSEFIEKDKWNIEKQLLKERVEVYRKTEIFLHMKQCFYDKKLSIWDLKEEEIITWIDTMTLLRRVFLDLFAKGIDQEKMKIIMEYPLINGNYMRTDYLFVYDRLIFVMEFGMFNQDEKRSEERYTKKLQESINYRQIIDNQVSKNIEVINYALIYRPEYDRYAKKFLDENSEYNKLEIKKIAVYLDKIIKKQDDYSAIKQLEILDS
jgi:hypothetical protein